MLTYNKLKMTTTIKQNVILCFIFLFFGFCSVYSRVLTLDECLKIGLENNKTLKISKSKVTAANEKFEEINAARYPTLKFNGTYSRLSKVDPFYVEINGRKMSISPVLLNNTQIRLTANQPLFTGFRLESNSEMNEMLSKATEEDMKKDINQLVLDIKTSFWTYFNANSSLASIDESIRQMKGHVSDLENMYKSGLATLNDLLKTQLQLSNLELSRFDVENAVKMSMMNLNNLIGLPVDEENTINSEFNYNGNSELFDKTDLTNIINQRNEIKAMELRVKASESGINLAQSAWWPQFNLSANYILGNPNPRVMPSQEKFIGTWDVNLNLTMDIWNWTAGHQTAQAEANLEQSKLALSQLKDGLTLEIKQSILNIKKIKEKIKTAGETVKQAEENFRVTNQKFQSGVAINSDLLDAESLLLVSKLNYSTSIAEFEIAKAKYEKAVGINNIK